MLRVALGAHQAHARTVLHDLTVPILNPMQTSAFLGEEK
jgi:hypothetical protein